MTNSYTEDAGSAEDSAKSLVFAEAVVAAEDAVLLVVAFECCAEQLELEPPARAAPVAELGVASRALHVIAAGAALDVDLYGSSSSSNFL